MSDRFRIHYTVADARDLLPHLRGWFDQLDHLRQRVEQNDAALAKLLEGGRDVGGEAANRQVIALAEFKRVLNEFDRREIQVKDLERGLVDFPAFVGGREVFLCWERDEEDITHWHDLDTGYSRRESLDE